MKKKPTSSKFFIGARVALGWLIKLLFGIRILNPENEPSESGYLICSNHVSAADAIVICYSFRKNQAWFMAKKELFKIPILKQLLTALGAFPVDRGGADVGAVKRAIALIGEGKNVGIFPQGHRYPGVDPRTTPTKKGAGLIASRAECPIVPVCILRKGNRSRIFRKSYIVIGDMIPYSEIEKMGDYAEITQTVFNKICDLGEDAAGKYGLRL